MSLSEALVLYVGGLFREVWYRRLATLAIELDSAPRKYFDTLTLPSAWAWWLSLDDFSIRKTIAEQGLLDWSFINNS